MPGLLDHLVMDYPYEDNLCMFYTKFENPEAYEHITKTKHPYYRDIASGLKADTLRTALDLAVVFKEIHVHPIDLPIYRAREVIRISDQRLDRYRGLQPVLSKANLDDQSDQIFQQLLHHLGRRRSKFIAQRINWHLMDANVNDAPIIASDRMLRLYNYKLSRAAIPPDERTTLPFQLLRLNQIVESRLGISFKISTWDDLISLRRDPDIYAYRTKLEEFLTRIRSGESTNEVEQDVEDAVSKIKDMQTYRRRTRILGYLSPAVLAAEVLLRLGVPVVTAILGTAAASQEVYGHLLEHKYRWLLFKIRPLAARR